MTAVHVISYFSATTRDVPIVITLITDDGAGSEMLRQEVLQEMERVQAQIMLQISIDIAEVDRFGESYSVQLQCACEHFKILIFPTQMVVDQLPLLYHLFLEMET